MGRERREPTEYRIALWNVKCGGGTATEQHVNDLLCSEIRGLRPSDVRLRWVPSASGVVVEFSGRAKGELFILVIQVDMIYDM